MSGTIVLLDHPVGQREDRASRHLAELGYRLEWACPGKGEPLPAPRPEHVAAIVYGGAESANDDADKTYIRAELDWIEGWLETGKPLLGLCLGAQLLARVLGARIEPHPEGHYEIGYVQVRAPEQANGFLGELTHVYHWHKEGFEVPDGAELLVSGPTFPNQAFRYGAGVFGLQFHPEVTVPMLTRWMDEAGHMLENPNAHPRERQLADAGRFDTPLADWLESFLDDWLGPSS